MYRSDDSPTRGRARRTNLRGRTIVRGALAACVCFALATGALTLGGCSAGGDSASGSGQTLSIGIGPNGYEPSTVEARAGVPITLKVGQGSGCRSGFVIPSLGVQQDVSAGPATIQLGALKPGTYPFSCAMNMVKGELVVR